MQKNLNNHIILSVCVFAYNHEKYIEQAIESVLSQKTNFNFEIIIGEDGSKDTTIEILDRYKQNYSDRLKVLHQDQSKKIFINGRPSGRFNFINTLKNCKGKYIALLDGDDYWTDPYKLQKQVDFLEANPQFSMCFTSSKVIDSEDNIISDDKLPEQARRNLSQIDLVTKYAPITLTSMFRKELFNTSFLNNYKKVLNGDTILFAHLLGYGDAAYLPLNTACYRIHSGGIWSLKDSLEKQVAALKTFIALQSIVRKENQTTLKNEINRKYQNLLWQIIVEKPERFLVLYLQYLVFNIKEKNFRNLFASRHFLYKYYKNENSFCKPL
jgi:glycosyltransferase involved in cell wall biosynthesis